MTATPSGRSRLYEWNAAISAAFWESLSYLEFALRNTLDDRLAYRYMRLGRTGRWVFDPARELGRDGRGGIFFVAAAVHEASFYFRDTVLTPTFIYEEPDLSIWGALL